MIENMLTCPSQTSHYKFSLSPPSFTICDNCSIFGHNLRPGDHSRMCFSHIQSLQCHFDLSEVIFTYILPTTPILHRITLCFIPPPLKDFVSLLFDSNCVPLHFQTLSLIYRPQHTVFYLVLSCFL